MSEPLYETGRKLEKSDWLALAALAALVALCFLYRLGGAPLLGKDEPRYAEVAREMFASGDWVTPRLAGHTWFEKPALAYWLMAAGYSALGVSEVAARLGSALLGALGVGVVYAAARRAWGARAGLYAGAALATSAMWFAFARAASFDMPLAATMAAALGALYAYDVETRARRRLALAAVLGASVGASMLAKGLAGPVLLGGIGLCYGAFAARWREVRAGEVAAAAACCALVAASWYWPVYDRNGWPFVEDFFVRHHFKRYLTNEFHHPAPWYFYALVAAGGLLPWTLALAGGSRALASVLRRRAANDDERLVWLAALWALVPLAFFSLSTSKLPGYVLPSFPGLALLVAWVLARRAAPRWALAATAALLAVLGVALALYARGPLGGEAGAYLLGVPLLVGGALAWAFVARGRGEDWTSAWLGAVAGGMALTVVAVASLLLPRVAETESLGDLAAPCAVELGPGEVVVPYRLTEYGPAFYARGRVAVDGEGEILIADTVDAVLGVAAASPAGSALCVTNEAGERELAADGRLRVTRLAEERRAGRAGRRVLVRVAQG